MHTKDEVIIFQEIRTDDVIFRLEEYWEEDDAGYCVSDFILAKHTRVSAYSPEGKLLRQFDLDSREYDKSMRLEGGVLAVRWHPEYNEEREDRIDVKHLELCP